MKNITSFLVRAIAGSLICFTSVVSAKNISPKPSSEVCPSGKKHYRASVRHIEGGGIGYSQGYTTLEVFLAPDPSQWSLMPFFDARGHVFDNGKWAANAGVGIRKIVESRAYGLNVFYDYRDTNKIHYNQIGLGLETLGKFWDFRINGYLPVGKKITSPYDTKFDRFSDHRMILSRKYQFAMKGADAEFGFHFGKSRLFDFYAAAGPYYYIGEIGHNIWGGKGRISCMYKDYITLEISNSYDAQFKNNFQGQITFSLPFGGKSRVKKKGCRRPCELADALTSRMVQPVGREEIIVVGSKKGHVTATDSLTGQPLYFVFVDNTSNSAGTYQSPYPTLALVEANSQPGSIIYVFPGNGTTTGMDAGITLQANQKLWGSGISQFIQTAQGGITIPAQSSFAPQMTNTAGDGITLATGNEIRGVTLTGAANNGIYGLNPENIQISSCSINGSQLDHIHLVYSSSSGTATLSNLDLTNGAASAVYIDSNSPFPMTCSVSHCRIEGNGLNSINASFSNEATVLVENNTIVDNGSCSIFAFSGSSTLLVSNNTFIGSTSINLAPLIITAAAHPLSATISNNTISENVCGGVRFFLNNTNTAQLILTNNHITNNGIGAIGSLGAPLFIDPNGTTSGNCSLTLSNNTISGNAGSALYVFDGSFTDLQATVTGNQITGNGGGGLIFADACSTFTLVATNNTISQGGDHGISTGGGIVIDTANITISNNHINENANSANGIILSHTGTNLNFFAANNEINGNDSTGIIFYSSSSIGNIIATIENNTINDNQNFGFNAAGGIDLEQYTNLTATLTNNTLNNNAAFGVYIRSSLSAPSTCLEMTGNNSNTGYSLSSGPGTFSLAPCNVNAMNTGTITKSSVTSVQSCPGAALCP